MVPATADDGQCRAGPIGGYAPSKNVGVHRDWLVELARTEAFTLRGLLKELAECGLEVDYRTVWKFVHREGLSFKKTVLASEQGR